MIFDPLLMMAGIMQSCRVLRVPQRGQAYLTVSYQGALENVYCTIMDCKTFTHCTALWALHGLDEDK